MVRRIGRIELLVFAVAMAARVGLVLAGGGYGGSMGYDASVYYTAGDAFLYGRMPYSNFTFLHPPGVILATAPFAFVGNLTSDHSGFVLACLAFTVLGALSAVLVVRVARRLNVNRAAAVAGGFAYAAWPGASASEYLCRLEPLGNLLVLLGLLAFLSADQSERRKLAALSGAAFAAAASVKIWWLLPLLVVLAAHALPARRVRLKPFLLGAAAAVLVIDVPFLLVGRGNALHMLLLDQLGRPTRRSTLFRLANISGASIVHGPLGRHGLPVLAFAVVLTLICLSVLALRVNGGWIIATMLLTQFVALLQVPSYYEYYNDYLAPPAAIAVAIALSHRARSRVRLRARLWQVASPVAAAVLAIVIAAAVIAKGTRIVGRYPSSTLARGVAQARCVMSNNPSALILLDVLSRNHANGCPDYVDLEGRLYGVDRPRAAHPSSSAETPWQRDLYRYLLSGDALALYPAGQAGLSPKIRAVLARTPVLARSHGFEIYDTSGEMSKAPDQRVEGLTSHYGPHRSARVLR